MKRKITALCACLALALCLLPLFAQRAEAADLDYIASYDISVTPNAVTAVWTSGCRSSGRCSTRGRSSG